MNNKAVIVHGLNDGTFILLEDKIRMIMARFSATFFFFKENCKTSADLC